MAFITTFALKSIVSGPSFAFIGRSLSVARNSLLDLFGAGITLLYVGGFAELFKACDVSGVPQMEFARPATCGEFGGEGTRIRGESRMLVIRLASAPMPKTW